jgi:hypothetical protein
MQINYLIYIKERDFMVNKAINCYAKLENSALFVHIVFMPISLLWHTYLYLYRFTFPRYVLISCQIDLYLTVFILPIHTVFDEKLHRRVVIENWWLNKRTLLKPGAEFGCSVEISSLCTNSYKTNMHQTWFNLS